MDQIFAHGVCSGSPLVVRLVRQAAWCGADVCQGRITWSRFSWRAVGDGGDAVPTKGWLAKGREGDDDGKGERVWGDEGFSFWGLSAW